MLETEAGAASSGRNFASATLWGAGDGGDVDPGCFPVGSLALETLGAGSNVGDGAAAMMLAGAGASNELVSTAGADTEPHTLAGAGDP